MDSQNIVVAMPLEDKLLGPLHNWGKRFDWSHIHDVHFLHVVKKHITPLEFGLMESPDDETFKEMTPTLEKYLQEEAKQILPPDFKGSVFFHIEKDSNPAEETVEKLKSLGASLVVVATHGRHGMEGLLHNSFTDHMIKYAPCDVFVVRPQ